MSLIINNYWPASQCTSLMSFQRSSRLLIRNLSICCKRHIRPSFSSWSSILHVVPEKNPGDWHPCGDYWDLNNVTTPDHYPISHIQDFTTTLHGLLFFLVQAYHQIPVEPSDIPKISIKTPLDYVNLYRSHLDYTILHKHFNDLLIRFYMTYTFVIYILYILHTHYQC